MTPTFRARDPHRQLAVLVGGDAETLDVVEPVLDGQVYDLEFVAPDDEPYATIAALKPDLVVLGLDLEDRAGFHLLTMLRLDPATRSIPVWSYVGNDGVAARGAPSASPNRAEAGAGIDRAHRH
ncbi:MAG: hypothetical protein ACT4QD_03025 [Acidobacteriota bacterium]